MMWSIIVSFSGGAAVPGAESQATLGVVWTEQGWCGWKGGGVDGTGEMAGRREGAW